MLWIVLISTDHMQILVNFRGHGWSIELERAERSQTPPTSTNRALNLHAKRYCFAGKDNETVADLTALSWSEDDTPAWLEHFAITWKKMMNRHWFATWVHVKLWDQLLLFASISQSYDFCQDMNFRNVREVNNPQNVCKLCFELSENIVRTLLRSIFYKLKVKCLGYISGG